MHNVSSEGLCLCEHVQAVVLTPIAHNGQRIPNEMVKSYDFLNADASVQVKKHLNIKYSRSAE